VAALRTALTALALCLLAAPALSARTLGRYALLLQDPPAVASRSVVRLGMGPEVLTAAAAIQLRQDALRAELRRRRFHVAGSTQLLVNAVYVSAAPSQLAELAALPGVRAVRFLPPVHPLLDRAEQLVNLQGAWGQTPLTLSPPRCS